jgi:hypothetical protein
MTILLGDNMNYDLILTFCDPVTKENEFDIPFKLANNSTSLKWLKMLYHDIYVNQCTWNNNRYVGFTTNSLNKASLAKELNQLIAICEKERPGHFKFVAHADMTQDDFNRMHVWFETYRGKYLDPHHFFKTGTPEFKAAIERFNEIIHIWEKLDRYKRNDQALITFNFEGNKTELDEEDMKNFEFERREDTLYLGYKMTGKTLIDVCFDEDDHVGNDNIQPFRFLSSDFQLNTKGLTREQLAMHKQRFDRWFERNSNYLAILGFRRDDPRCTIGRLPLAHSLIANTREIIEPRQFLKTIRIFEE